MREGLQVRFVAGDLLQPKPPDLGRPSRKEVTVVIPRVRKERKSIYSATSLLWTPWGPGEVSCMERCSRLRGTFIAYSGSAECLNTEVSGCPLRGVPLQTLSTNAYLGVLSTGTALFDLLPGETQKSILQRAAGVC